MDLTPTLPLSFAATAQVRDTCLCLHTQRAARVLARRFDEVLRPVGLTNGQFSLLNGLNRPSPASISDLSVLLGADRTTLTAALKPLVRQGLATISVEAGDRRGRRVALTPLGHARLAAALPLWIAAHGRLEMELALADPVDANPARLRRDLKTLAKPQVEAAQ